MYNFLRNYGMNAKIRHFSVRLHVLCRTAEVQLPNFTFMALYSRKLWLNTLKEGIRAEKYLHRAEKYLHRRKRNRVSHSAKNFLVFSLVPPNTLVLASSRNFCKESAKGRKWKKKIVIKGLPKVFNLSKGRNQGR